MNTVIYRFTDGSDKDFEYFYRKTEDYYSSIVGGVKNRADFVPYNISEMITDVLIAYDEDKPVGCTGLKRYSDNDAEIKRVWVEEEYRGRHIAKDMILQIEKRAKEAGYIRTILQTREQMKEAIGLYENMGYARIDNYPPYDRLLGAVCFAKSL